MKFNQCFNFKLSKCIVVFGLYIRGVIDCNKWKTEKRHECANMGKVKRLELRWQLYCTSLPVRDLENFRPMDFCWTECTNSGAKVTFNTFLLRNTGSSTLCENTVYICVCVCVCVCVYIYIYIYIHIYIYTH